MRRWLGAFLTAAIVMWGAVPAVALNHGGDFDVAFFLAAEFDEVDVSTVRDLHDAGLGFGEILRLTVAAVISGQTLDEVVETSVDDDGDLTDEFREFLRDVDPVLLEGLPKNLGEIVASAHRKAHGHDDDHTGDDGRDDRPDKPGQSGDVGKPAPPDAGDKPGKDERPAKGDDDGADHEHDDEGADKPGKGDDDGADHEHDDDGDDVDKPGKGDDDEADHEHDDEGADKPGKGDDDEADHEHDDDEADDDSDEMTSDEFRQRFAELEGRKAAAYEDYKVCVRESEEELYAAKDGVYAEIESLTRAKEERLGELWKRLKEAETDDAYEAIEEEIKTVKAEYEEQVGQLYEIKHELIDAHEERVDVCYSTKHEIWDEVDVLIKELKAEFYG